MKDFRRHIKDAITLNEKRLPLYAQLTDNQSIPFSKQLIKYERFILMTAGIVDFIGDSFQKKGIPFIKAEFVEMSQVRNFAESFPEGIDFTTKLLELDFKKFKSQLKMAISSKDTEQVITVCNEILMILSNQSHLYNMSRHLIESIRRVAYLIPLHQSKAHKIGVKPPSFYAWILIKSHIILLNQSKTFDEQVAFIQEGGVPFIWQDLPTIGMENSY